MQVHLVPGWGSRPGLAQAGTPPVLRLPRQQQQLTVHGLAACCLRAVQVGECSTQSHAWFH